MNIKGSKTEQNLMAAFSGESQARNKYDYYASKAKKEGYEQIAAIFQETALNERNTQNCGSNFSTESTALWTTLLTLLQAKTTNGRKCTQNLLALPTKKASMKLPKVSVALLQLKKLTKKDTKNLQRL